MIISVAGCKRSSTRKDKQKSNTCQKCIESEKSNIQNCKWQQESFIQQTKLYIIGMEDGKSMTTFYYCSVNHHSGLETKGPEGDFVGPQTLFAWDLHS